VKKKGCGEANDINKQTMYIAPKSTNELRVHYALEPAWGSPVSNFPWMTDSAMTVG